MQNEQQLRDLGITPWQKANLIKLRDHLLTVDSAVFGMRKYCATKNGIAFNISHRPADLTECGSVACAVGHGPYAGIETIPGESWFEYSARVFVTANRRVWAFIFAAEWSWFDNTPSGAARRIDYVLEHGIDSAWPVELDRDDYFDDYIAEKGLPYE